MQCLVAFRTNTQAYVLPITSAALGLTVISQPKYVPLQQAIDLPELVTDLIPSNWIEACAKSDLLSSNEYRQRIYCWWMGLSQAEREYIYRESLSASTTA